MAVARPKPVVIVTGALAPYTHLLYDLLADALDRPVHVMACSARETGRRWELDPARRYGFEVLPGLRWHRNTVLNHYANPAVAVRLLALDPAVLVLNDFSPTMLIAAAVAKLRSIPYGLRTDGVPETDPGLRPGVRRLSRRLIARGAAFGIGPSEGSRRLLTTLGLAGPFAFAPLFPAWRPNLVSPEDGRPYDVLFCGTLDETLKGARFFTDVVLGCAAKAMRLRVRVVGDGPLRAEMEDRMTKAGLEVRFDGFLAQSALAEAYGSAKLFLFPTRGDVWGVVVQEALQSGTVVIASPHAGASREMLLAHRCGIVAPLDPDAWVEAILRLLADPSQWDALSRAGRHAQSQFTSERAVAAYVASLQTLLASAPTPGYGPKITSSL